MDAAPPPISPPPGWTAERSGGTLLLQSEGTCFWTFTVLPDGPDPRDAVESAFAGLREEYGEVDESPAAGAPLAPGEVGRDAEFFVLDSTAAARGRAFRVAGVTYLVFYQGADHDLEECRDTLEQLGRRAWLGVAAAVGGGPVGGGPAGALPGEPVDRAEFPPVRPR